MEEKFSIKNIEGKMPASYIFRLYVNASLSKNLPAKLDRLFKERLGDNYSLEVVDVLRNVDKAREDAIFIIPTLVKLSPHPIKKIIGDFSFEEKIFLALDIKS